jgi:hypothetical protein
MTTFELKMISLPSYGQGPPDIALFQAHLRQSLAQDEVGAKGGS